MSDSHNIRVVTRIRPLSGNEKSQGCTDVIKITKGEKGKSDPQLSIGADDKVRGFGAHFHPLLDPPTS